MAGKSFESRLVRPQGVGTWTFAPVPEDVTSDLGLRARTRVKGTVDGVPFSCALMPGGGSKYFVVVNRVLREAIGKTDGDRVKVSILVDRSPVKVGVPSDFRLALSRSARAKASFQTMAPSHKKAYVQWIEGAKKAETRQRRIRKAVEMLRVGRTLK